MSPCSEITSALPTAIRDLLPVYVTKLGKGCGDKPDHRILQIKVCGGRPSLEPYFDGLQWKSYKQGFLKDAESSLAVTAGQAASMAAIPHSFLGGADMDALLWGPGDQSNSLPEHAKVRKQGAACILGIVLETDLSRGRPLPTIP